MAFRKEGYRVYGLVRTLEKAKEVHKFGFRSGGTIRELTSSRRCCYTKR